MNKPTYAELLLAAFDAKNSNAVLFSIANELSVNSDNPEMRRVIAQLETAASLIKSSERILKGVVLNH